ncbi:hypothetical protein BLA24_07410 [Streptomyces cinnamoneus]|uniref:Uncharacterized protein n=1 Tax=Streptomyces cinnamoneus TaxID=53446 RepID=A0A2G1XMW6_STRCJ|nr:hypothetical protein BLA24_07410 [Streptomyces cinnamoneus]
MSAAPAGVAEGPWPGSRPGPFRTRADTVVPGLVPAGRTARGLRARMLREDVAAERRLFWKELAALLVIALVVALMACLCEPVAAPAQPTGPFGSLYLQ